MWRFPWLLALLFCAPAPPAPAATPEEAELIFRQSGGPKTIEYRESLRALPGGGYEAIVLSSEGGEDRLFLDAAGGTLEWRHLDPALDSELLARREGGAVFLSGRFRGRAVEKRYDFASLPWYEFQELSLQFAPPPPSNGASFWTVDRRDLSALRFAARPSGRELLEGPLGSFPSRRYDLTISGVPPILFLSRFWLREGDSRYLRLSVPALPGAAATRVELVAEGGM